MTASLIDGRYLPLGTLGRGGMASVLRAYDRVHERVVALKVPSERTLDGGEHPLAGEYAAWAPIVHPNVVRALDYGIQGDGPLASGSPYLVLEHVAGSPVHRALGAGRLAPSDLERVGVLALRALQGVHDAGLVHRDLKPGNLLVRRHAGRPLELKLTDFGLAAPVGTREEPGTISGSLPFVAPEAILGDPLDARTDLYGLGIALYHLATGAMPCRAGAPETLVRWHLTGPECDPRRLRPRLPLRIAQLIRALTARRPGERPASAAEALARLGERAGGPPGPAPLAPALRGLRYRLRLALDAAVEGHDRVLHVTGSVEGAARIHELVARAGLTGAAVHRLQTSSGPARQMRRVMRELTHEMGASARTDAGAPELGRIDALGRDPCGGDEPNGMACRLAASLLRAGRQRPRLVVIWEAGTSGVDPNADLADRLEAGLRRRGRGRGRGGLLLLRVSCSATGPGSSDPAG